MSSKEKPYVLYVAELIYSKICQIKKKNPDFSNINALESFIGTNEYKEISSGEFHDKYIENLKKIILLILKLKKKYQMKQ